MLFLYGKDLSEQKLEIESSNYRTNNSFFVLRYKMIMNRQLPSRILGQRFLPGLCTSFSLPK